MLSAYLESAKAQVSGQAMPLLVDNEILQFWLVTHQGKLAMTLTELGGPGEVLADLQGIARALAFTGAPYLFMAHSHPSGDARPSTADIGATRRIWHLARTLGASLQDHLIVGRKGSFSFRANGLI